MDVDKYRLEFFYVTHLIYKSFDACEITLHNI